jgi:hypothetical protein
MHQLGHTFSNQQFLQVSAQKRIGRGLAHVTIGGQRQQRGWQLPFPRAMGQIAAAALVLHEDHGHTGSASAAGEGVDARDQGVGFVCGIWPLTQALLDVDHDQGFLFGHTQLPC